MAFRRQRVTEVVLPNEDTFALGQETKQAQATSNYKTFRAFERLS